MVRAEATGYANESGWLDQPAVRLTVARAGHWAVLRNLRAQTGTAGNPGVVPRGIATPRSEGARFTHHDPTTAANVSQSMSTPGSTPTGWRPQISRRSGTP